MRVQRPDAFGTFHPASFAVRLGFQYEEWQDVVRKFGDPPSADNFDWQQCCERERRLILAIYHERDHLAFYLSSPVGLLIWRCYHILSQGVRFFCKKFDEVGTVKFDGRLSDWYKEKGFEQLRQGVLEGRAAPDLVAQHGPERAAEICHETMLDLCDEWDSIETLLDVLTTGDEYELKRFRDWTLKDFAELAQEAYGWLCKRSGLPMAFEWVPSRDAANNDAPLFPEDARFNALNIYEAAARFHELQLFPHFENFTEADKEWWRKEFIHGLYKPAFDAVGGLDSDPFVARAYLGMSCSTPIDPATIQPGTTIAADEVLPWFRLKKLQNQLQIERIDTSDGPGTILFGPQELLYETMAPFAQALRAGLHGPNGRWFPVPAGPRAPLLEASNDARKMLLQEFQTRFAEQLQRFQTGDADADPVAPKLRVFDDLIPYSLGERIDGLLIHYALVWNALVDTYAVSLLKRELVDPYKSVRDRLDAGIRRRYIEAGKEYNNLLSEHLKLIFSHEFLTLYFGTVGMKSFVFAQDRK